MLQCVMQNTQNNVTMCQVTKQTIMLKCFNIKTCCYNVSSNRAQGIILICYSTRPTQSWNVQTYTSNQSQSIHLRYVNWVLISKSFLKDTQLIPQSYRSLTLVKLSGPTCGFQNHTTVGFRVDCGITKKLPKESFCVLQASVGWNKLKPLMLTAAKSSQTVMLKSLMRSHSWENIWRRNGNQITTNNCLFQKIL